MSAANYISDPGDGAAQSRRRPLLPLGLSSTDQRPYRTRQLLIITTESATQIFLLN